LERLEAGVVESRDRADVVAEAHVGEVVEVRRRAALRGEVVDERGARGVDDLVVAVVLEPDPHDMLPSPRPVPAGPAGSGGDRRGDGPERQGDEQSGDRMATRHRWSSGGGCAAAGYEPTQSARRGVNLLRTS